MAGAGGGRRSAGATPRGVRAGGLGRLHERALRGGRALPPGCGVTPDPLRLPETPGDPRELKRPPETPGDPQRPLKTARGPWRPSRAQETPRRSPGEAPKTPGDLQGYLETPGDPHGHPWKAARAQETPGDPYGTPGLPPVCETPPPPPSVGPFPHVR
ncbi:proline-rich protein 2-like isoform X1 [Ammospiza nelsoni]|uniref:proline-rich protein 2-like isoform X1 n=1 Tax=Ammospiza nelsoni TaxID=2857394 RepID=UPI00286B6273|nr:proline-rich protein 2-like isoform X1 [Ammospiza nelsoni]